MKTLRSRKNLTILFPALSSLCLGAGYLPAGWWALVAAALTFLLWMAARRWKGLPTASVALAAAAAAAACGLVTGAALLWMLPAVTLALASWDLALLEARLAGSRAPALEQQHDATLALALGVSLLAAAVGQLVRVQIPFLLMLALVLLAYFSLDQLLRAVGK